MMEIWGVHMGEMVGISPIENKYIGIGWHKLGDLTNIAESREKLKRALSNPDFKINKGAIPGNAGVLYRFVKSMKIGDIVIYPSKHDRMINIGKVSSDYFYDKDNEYRYPNQRKVEWLGSFPRSDFSQAALNEIGAFITLFSVKRHANEFLSKVELSQTTDIGDTESDEDIVDDEASTKSIANQAEQTTEDFIIKELHTKLDGYEFEYFVAHILECMGYKARVSQKSGDGGVDVIAHKDELGFEPPIIKVQCKKSTGSNGEQEANQLLGTLGDGEFGLFVNLGSYSRPARLLERNKAKLRLIDGDELVQLIMEHYHKLSPRYRDLLPLKQIYVADLHVDNNT